MLDFGCWVLDSLDLQFFACSQPSVLYWLFIFHSINSILIPSSFPFSCAIHLIPKSQTPNSKPQTPNLQTSNPKPQTPNLKPQTPNPKPQTSNLKTQTSNPKLQTSKPKPQTPKPTQTPNPNSKPQNPNLKPQNHSKPQPKPHPKTQNPNSKLLLFSLLQCNAPHPQTPSPQGEGALMFEGVLGYEAFDLFCDFG